MNNCALNLSATVIAAAQPSTQQKRRCIVSLLCNYCALCLFLCVEAVGRWVEVVENTNMLAPVLM